VRSTTEAKPIVVSQNSRRFRADKRTKLPSFVKGLVGIIAALCLWQVIASIHLVSADYFPSAWAVLGYTVSLLVQPGFLGQVWATLESMLVGLLLAAVVAVPTGLVLGRFPLAYRLTNLVVEILRPIPAVALAPLAILLFGISNWSTISLVVWTSVWPILINSIYGMQNVDPLPRETAHVFGLGRTATIIRIDLPSTAPFIFTGARIALAIALSVAIAGEMVAGSGNGLGAWIVEASSNGSLAPVYAATLVSGVLGYILNALSVKLESRMFFWHPSFRKQRHT
jgi:NitT/TauT family transport system permease protein